MAGITLVQAEAKLTELLAALTKVAAGQKIIIDGVEFTRANMAELDKVIDNWDRRCKQLSRTNGIRVREVIPR
ncbi:MAG: hypothetical protein Q7U75_17810 [Desulfobacterales bacterium]|nr:hypothetical protein [Desulfobacterales bacterium]